MSNYSVIAFGVGKCPEYFITVELFPEWIAGNAYELSVYGWEEVA